MGSGFGDAETVVTRWMRFRCKDDNLPGEMKRPHAAPYMFRPAGLLLVDSRVNISQCDESITIELRKSFEAMYIIFVVE